MITPLSQDQIQSLRQLDGCLLANAVEPFGVRLRNEGFADGTIHCLFPKLQPIVGHAVTVKIRATIRPRGRQLTWRTRIGGIMSFPCRRPGSLWWRM